jgi:hypothetical protein
MKIKSEKKFLFVLFKIPITGKKRERSEKKKTKFGTRRRRERNHNLKKRN